MHPTDPSPTTAAEACPAATAAELRSDISTPPTFLLGAVAVISTVFVYYYVDRFGTNVPSGDDWDLLQTILQWKTRGFDFPSLIAFHNEHRIILTRVLLGTVLVITGGNFKMVLLFNAAFCLATLVMIFALLREERKTSLPIAVGSIAIAFLVTGWFQWQNLLWAFQLPWFFLPLSLVGCVWCISRVRNNRLCIATTAVWLLLALCCMASGIVVWAAVIPALWLRIRRIPLRAQLAILASYCALTCIVALIYFIGLPPSSQPAAVGPILADPPRFLQFFFSVLGSPFSAWISILGPDFSFGFGVGLAGCALALVAMGASWKDGLKDDSKALFGLGLGFLIFSIASVFLIAVGRFRMGFSYQIESRYSTFALYFYVGIVVLMLIPLRGDLRNSAYTRAASGAYYFACALAGVACIWGGPIFLLHGANIRFASSLVKTELNLSAALKDQPELRNGIHTVSGARLPGLLQSLEDHRLWSPARVGTIAESELVDIEDSGNVDGGSLEGTSFVLSGWARTPDNRPPDAVLALIPAGNHRWIPIARSGSERIPRHDVSVTMQQAGLGESGWRLRLDDAAALPHVTLVGYSGEQGRFYRIPFDATYFARK